MNKGKLTRKLSNNNDGATSGTWLIIIIVIALIVWQYGLPYLGLDSFTETLQNYTPFEDEPAFLTIDYTLANPTNHVQVSDTVVWMFGNHLLVDLENPTLTIVRYKIESTEPFPFFALYTNAPFRLTEPYSIRITNTYVNYYYYGYDSSLNIFDYDSAKYVCGEYVINNLADIGKDEFFIPMTNLIQDDYSLNTQANLIEFTFFDGDGTPLLNDRFILTKVQG